jgi:hypothetical protein
VNQPLGPDERLLAELGELFRQSSPLPRSVVNMAKESYTWRTIDAELAELTADSLLERPEARTRGAAEPRALTFEARDLVLEIEVDVSGHRRQLLGQLIPPQAARIEVRQGGAVRMVEADTAGRFAVGDLQARPVSLRCQRPGRDPVATAWVRL